MAKDKVDLPGDLGLVANPDTDPLAADKDQAASENTIPLSPQWLYTKTSDSKSGLSAVPGDTRPPNSLPQGVPVDSTKRDIWRPEGSQDKKDRRRNVHDVENSRRWHDEERETGLLGRKERRKDGDRENEYRKNDRATRETGDSRPLLSSDRWHEVTSRNPGLESRRDSKWSSKWGPEDKEDSRLEKKTDTSKEDPHVEKQSLIGGNRLLSESDPRDKWKPRHRQETGGAAVYRAAPGFGVERGRVDEPNVRFAPGRGKSIVVGNLPFSRPSSSGPIGAEHGKSSLSANRFRYPRGKILDIYRKNKILSPFDSTPEGFEEVHQITQSSSMAPLAFVKPDSEEVTILEDISKGKVISSEVYCDSHWERIRKASDCEIEPDSKDKVSALFNGKVPCGVTSLVSKDDAFSNVSGGLIHSEKKDDQANVKNNGPVGLPDFINNPIFGAANSTSSLDFCTELPDDSNSLFTTSFVQETPGSNIQQQINNPERELLEQSTSTELSLLYLDPQGETQGPFLAVDVLAWCDAGFFGTDLPVVLSDAPEGTPFRPLGEVITSVSSREHTVQSDTTIGNLEAIRPDSISSSITLNDWQSSGSGDPFRHQVQPRISDPDVSITSQYEMSPLYKPAMSDDIPGAERHSSHDFSGQDTEEVLYMGRPVNGIQNPLGKLDNDIHDLSRTSIGHHLLTATGQADSLNRNVPTESDVNPFGLSWSELEGTHHNGPLSSNIAGIGDRGHIINPLLGGDASLVRNKQEPFGVRRDSVVQDAWSGNNRRNTTSNVLQDSLDASHLARFEPEANHFNLEEHFLSQQFQEQQLEQRHLMSSPHQNLHSSGSYLEQLQSPLYQQQSINREHLLKLHLQQQRRLQQLEQEEKLHQQQQQLHQMQLLQQQHQQQKQQQQQQLFLEKLLHQKLHDPNFVVPHVDPLRGENTLNQVLYRQHMLRELQQQAHHLHMDHDPSLDQLIQAKIGHNLHHEHHNELLDVLTHPSHRHMLPLEQQHLLSLQQEQLQARQFPIASRQQPGMDEERQGGAWSVDESSQFVRGAASLHHTHSGRLGQSNFVQPLQRPSSFEQLTHLDRSFMLHDRMQRGNYALDSQSFERPAGIPRSNMELMNNLARLQGMGMQENHGQMNSPGQMGQFLSGSRFHQNWMPDEFTAFHLDAMERNWPDHSGQLPKSLTGSQYTQLHLAAEKQKRNTPADIFIEDRNRWSSQVGNDESSNHGLADLHHKKLVLQSSHPLGLVDGAPTSSYENRDPSWPFSRSATDHSFDVALDKMGLDDFPAEASLLTQLEQAHQVRSVNLNLEGQGNTYGSSGRLPFRSRSGLPEHKQFFPDIRGIKKEQLAHSMGGEVSRERIDLSDLKEGVRVKQHGSKSIGMNISVLDSLEGGIEQSEASQIDYGTVKIEGSIWHASFGGNGGGTNQYNYDMGADNAYTDQMVNDRMSGIFSRGSDISLLKHPHDPHILSSKGALSELPSVPPLKGNNSAGFAYSHEMREPGENPAAPAPETSSSKGKDMKFRRTSSYSDADAAPEALFIDMLKGTRKQMSETDASSRAAESTQDTAGSGGRNTGKKKGKKGKQIDPSLLGFKVHSNRILMGEIHRPE